jgi:aryl-alcohol dehydrogenase-like predicted oxidoreductase
MEKRRISRRGLEISRIGLGCVTFGREIDEAQSFRVLDYAFEHGINLLDTAEGYGGGQAQAYRRSRGIVEPAEPAAEMHSSEKIIGRWLKSNGLRSQVVLQTKIARNFTRRHLPDALDASLDRLQTGYVDIYLFHSYDPGTPLEEAMTAMTQGIASGKVHMAGCSNFSFEQLTEALRLCNRGMAPIETIQPVYNLVRREIEPDVLPLCVARGIAPVIYSPLGAGFLAGKYRPDTALPQGARFQVIPGHADEYFTPRNFHIVEQLRALAERLRVPMVRLALAWVLKNPAVCGALIGARGPEHINNALAALQTELTADIAAEMDAWGVQQV